MGWLIFNIIFIVFGLVNIYHFYKKNKNWIVFHSICVGIQLMSLIHNTLIYI